MKEISLGIWKIFGLKQKQKQKQTRNQKPETSTTFNATII